MIKMETYPIIDLFNETRDSITNLHLYIKNNNIEVPSDKKQAYTNLIDFWFTISIRDEIKGLHTSKKLITPLDDFLSSKSKLCILWGKYLEIFQKLLKIIGTRALVYFMEKSNKEPITIQLLSPKMAKKQLQSRTYTNKKGLKINPRDLVNEEHMHYIEIFEDVHKDDKIQIQFYLEGDFVGFVLLTIIPVDIYHPEAYTKEVQKENSNLFNMTTITNADIPFFSGPTYQLMYIQVEEGLRNKGTGSRMIKNMRRHYTFIVKSDNIIADRAFISAGCVNYEESIKIFRSI